MTRDERRRGGCLVVAAFVVFVAGLAGGWQLLTHIPSDRYGCTEQTVRAGERLTSSLVTVHVLNAGEAPGTAGRVSSALQARGFRPGSVANSTSAVTPEVAAILTTDRSDPQVQLVARQFADVSYREPDIELGSGVTVLIGDEFTTLTPKAARSITVKTDVTVCF